MHIRLDDLLANKEEDSFSTQRYYDTSIPHRFIGLKRLLSDLSALGYHAHLQAPHVFPTLGLLTPLAMENLPEQHRIRYAPSVLFGAGQADHNQLRGNQLLGSTSRSTS